MRVASRLAGVLLMLAVCLPLHGLWRLVRAPSPWPRWFLASMAWIIGVRRKASGTPLRRDVVFVANHQSWLDILVLAGATGTAFVAKAELRRTPLVSWLCRLNRTIFVERQNRMAVSEQIDMLRAALAEGWAVTIFPEGTTAPEPGLLPFKAALFQVLDPPPSGLRVQPVLIGYGAARPDIAWGGEPGQENALRILARAGSFPVWLTFLDPFDPRDFSGRKAIAAEARRRMTVR